MYNCSSARHSDRYEGESERGEIAPFGMILLRPDYEEDPVRFSEEVAQSAYVHSLNEPIY